MCGPTQNTPLTHMSQRTEAHATTLALWPPVWAIPSTVSFWTGGILVKGNRVWSSSSAQKLAAKQLEISVMAIELPVSRCRNTQIP
jgi:hypothetical protein